MRFRKGMNRVENDRPLASIVADRRYRRNPARGLRSRIHGATSTGRAVLRFVAPGDRMRAGRRPVQSHAHGGEIHPLCSELRAIRNPMLLLLLVGLLLRFATRQLFALLFQLPPRFTRFEPNGRRPEFFFQSQRDSVPQPRVAAARRYPGNPARHFTQPHRGCVPSGPFQSHTYRSSHSTRCFFRKDLNSS